MHNRLDLPKFCLLIGLGSLLSCQPGYRKQNGAWAWVSYDENVGKRVTWLGQVDNKSFKVLPAKNLPGTTTRCSIAAGW